MRRGRTWRRRSSRGDRIGSTAKPRRHGDGLLAQIKALRARARDVASVGNRRQRTSTNVERARDADEAARLCGRENP
jgi:hypothetical protein